MRTLLRRPVAPSASLVALVFGAALLAAPAASAQAPASNSARTWFPLDAVGNQWVLSNGAQSHTVEVAYAWAGYYRYVTGFQGQDFWTYYRPQSLVYRDYVFQWNGDTATWHFLFPFRARVAEAWRFDLSGRPCDTMQVHLQETGVTVHTPVGTFDNCRRYAFTLLGEAGRSCAKPQWADIFLAPGVGPVQALGTDGTTYDLVSANVNGRVYAPVIGPPTPPPALGPVAEGNGLRLSLRLDQPGYVNYENTIMCITTPCPSNAVNAEMQIELDVSNVGGRPRTFVFSNGGQVDLDVVDTNGRVVARYLARTPVTMAFTQVHLRPGESRTYSVQLELHDDGPDQHQLQSGKYEVRARFLHQDAQGVEPRQGFDLTTIPNPNPWP